MLEYITWENLLYVLESFFWPIFWTVTYVCCIALVFTTVGRIYRRATSGREAAVFGGPLWAQPGGSLMLIGAVGVATCAVLWLVIFGDLGRGVGLLIAHIHGTHDYRETVLLLVSTVSMLVTDIGSLIFLDHVPS